MNEPAHEARSLDGTVTRAGRPEARTIGGYAARFGIIAQLPRFAEIILPSAFNKSQSDGWPGVDGGGVVARWNHSNMALLGTTGSGTLRLTVDTTGLGYAVDLPRHRQDLLELVTRGDVRQASFMFDVLGDGEEWTTTADDTPLRVLRSVRLIDVAPVTRAAYPHTTTVALDRLARSLDLDLDELNELADHHRLAPVMRDRLGIRTGDQALTELMCRRTA